MNIACAKTGKRFSDAAAARECSSACHRLGYCPYEKNTDIGVSRKRRHKAIVSTDEWARIVALIESTSSPSRTPEELETYLHPDGSFEQSNAYADRVRHQESWGNFHDSGKYAGSSKAINWLIFGIIIFIIGLFVLAGWVR